MSFAWEDTFSEVERYCEDNFSGKLIASRTGLVLVRKANLIVGPRRRGIDMLDFFSRVGVHDCG